MRPTLPLCTLNCEMNVSSSTAPPCELFRPVPAPLDLLLSIVASENEENDLSTLPPRDLT